MKSGWERKRLGDVCNFVRGPFGGSLKKSFFVPDGYAVYEQQHAIYNQFNDIRYFITEEKFKEMKRFELLKNDLIMSCSGTMGRVAIVPDNIKKGIINQALLKLSPKKEILSNFLKLWMESQIFQDILQEYSGGAAIQNVFSVKILKEINIFLPAIEEQHRIVAILDEAFAYIAAAKEKAEQNLKNANEILEGYLAKIFSQRQSDWQDFQLSSLCKEITVGHVGKMKSEYKENGIPFLRSQNIRPFEVSLDNVMFINTEFHNLLKKSQLFPNDLAIVRTGYPGTAAVIPENLFSLNCSDLVIVRPKKEVNPHFLCAFFNSSFGKRLVMSKVVGAAQKHFNITAAKKVVIHLPPFRQQNIIVEQIERLRAEAKNIESLYQQKLSDLEELKKSVLQQAFSGAL